LTCWFLAAVLFLSVLIVMMMRPWSARSSAQDSPISSDSQLSSTPDKALPPATCLRIRVGASRANEETLLNVAAADWSQAFSTAIILNRTPRIFQTEAVPDRPIPRCQVRALRAREKLFLRLQWDDPTKNAPEAPRAQTGDGGDPSVLYKRPTGETAAFADAAAVMVPENWTGPAFPSLFMGDTNMPVTIGYWNASRGARLMSATGRATPQPTGQSIPHRARHENGQWLLTLELADWPDGYPMAFAVWDGQYGERDGLKFFSVWHVLTTEQMQ
jgi:hypothetical protein